MISLKNVSKVYAASAEPVTAIDDVSLQIEKGEFVAVMGPSGSGKSTLLHLMGTLDTPTSGEIELDGTLVSSLNDNQRTLLRRRKLGFVFQFFHLLPTMSAIENVIFPALLDKVPRKQAEARGAELLETVGLKHRMKHMPDELSGGEMQRVAIARALIQDPPILLADEPTGNVDSARGIEILSLLQSLNQDHQKTIVMVTHDKRSTEFSQRELEIKDGKISFDHRERPLASIPC